MAIQFKFKFQGTAAGALACRNSSESVLCSAAGGPGPGRPGSASTTSRYDASQPVPLGTQMKMLRGVHWQNERFTFEIDSDSENAIVGSTLER